MDDSFPRYLLSKQTVDDRALNKDVVSALRVSLPPEPITVIEVGAGIGTMLKRLVTWDLLSAGEYIMVDAMQENIEYARQWIPAWAREAGLSVEYPAQDQLQVRGPEQEIRVQLTSADVFTFIEQNETPADLLIAHAFLDLMPLPESLEKLLQLTSGLAWLTINFDGLSSLRPQLDPVLDGRIEALYHASMDARSSGGDSRTGRKLFEHLRTVHAEILAAGSSDWVVYGRDGKYAADEKRFLQFILGFFEDSLEGSPELERVAFANWLARRYEQIERGELVYIAHQMDFLIRKHW